MVDVQITHVNIRIVVGLALVAGVIIGGCSNSSSDDSIYPVSTSPGTDTHGQTRINNANNSPSGSTTVNYPSNSTSGTTTVSMSSSSVDNSKSTAANTSSSSGRDTDPNSSANSVSQSPPNTSPGPSSSQAKSNTSNTLTGTELVWRRKYYFKSSVYDACAFPETVKPKRVNAGTEPHELFFVRSKLEENSYFGKQIVDLNPYDFTSNPKNFSDHLKNMTRSDSYYHKLLGSTPGFQSVPRNKYSHSISVRDYINRTNLVEGASFGVVWKLVKNGTGLEIFAKKGARGIKRGDKLIQIGDIRIDSVTDTTTREKLFKELFPFYDGLVSDYYDDNLYTVNDCVDSVLNQDSYTGDDLYGCLEKEYKTQEEEEVEFVLFDHELNRVKKISILPRGYAMPGFPVTRVLVVDGRKVGYINVNDLYLRGGFATGVSDSAYSTLKRIYYYGPHKGVADMILDLRYAESGAIEFASQLAFMITGEGPSKGKQFVSYHHNSKHLVLSHLNREVPFIDACRKMYPCNKWGLAGTLANLFFLSGRV